MYSIHEVCERTGLTAHTLRYYERRSSCRMSAGVQAASASIRRRIWRHSE